SDEELKTEIAASHPYEAWLKNTQIMVHDLPLPKAANTNSVLRASLLDLQQAFGYTQESTKFLMSPMAATSQEAVGSMGNDTPI
ncbi:glutamate synthase central domain-containing protein, partial [Escherichia coli]